MSEKAISVKKIGELLRYTNSCQWIQYEGIYFVAEKIPKLANIGKFEFSKFGLPYHHSNTDCMNNSFKVTYAISVNSRRFYFP